MPPRDPSMSLLERLRAEEVRLVETLAECRRDISEITGEETEAPVTQLDEFLAERNTDFDWLIGGTIATGSVGMLVADPAVGKTTLLVQVALCLASGRDPFYEARVTRSVPCLYVAAEGSRAAFQNRVQAARQALGIPRGIGWFIQAKDRADYMIGSPGLEAMVARSQAKFVVLDTLGYFTKGEENSADDWKGHVMRPLRDMIARHGCTVLLVHHQVKESHERKGWQKGRGTSAMFGDLDFYLRMEPEEGDESGLRRVLFLDKNKYGLTRRWTLTYEPSSARFG